MALDFTPINDAVSKVAAASTARDAAHEADLSALRSQVATKDAALVEADRQITALIAEVAWFQSQQAPAPTPAPAPAPVDKVTFSIDVSALGTDADIPEAKKIADHKASLGVDNLQNVRIFIGARALSWTDARIQALTEKDSILISVSTRRTRTEIRNFLAATPERFRKRKGQVKVCYKHECEAEWSKAANGDAWLADYLAGNLDWAEELDASPFPTQSRDDVVKIMLWYSQHIGRPAGGLRETKDTLALFYGGQDFGSFGMDCYHYQVWLAKGRYATPTELFGKIIAFCRKVGRPCVIPEWGGELAEGDTDGAKRAIAIRDGGALLQANADVVDFANFWCAKGSKDAVTGLPRDHHLEIAKSNVEAFKALINA